MEISYSKTYTEKTRKQLAIVGINKRLTVVAEGLRDAAFYLKIINQSIYSLIKA